MLCLSSTFCVQMQSVALSSSTNADTWLSLKGKNVGQSVVVAIGLKIANPACFRAIDSNDRALLMRRLAASSKLMNFQRGHARQAAKYFNIKAAGLKFLYQPRRGDGEKGDNPG